MSGSIDDPQDASPRAQFLSQALVAWLFLYLAVGVEIILLSPQGTTTPLLVDWTGMWTVAGLFAVPACFLIGSVTGVRSPLLWVMVALTTVALAATTIHVAVLRTLTNGSQEGSVMLTSTLVLATVGLFVLVRLLEVGGRSLLLALLFLGLIASIVAPNFVRCRCQGPLTACKSNLKNIGTALEMYSTDHAGHYPRTLAALSPEYLKTLPTCPVAQADTYSLSYRKRAVPADRFTMFCAGSHHAPMWLPNHPVYTSQEGLISERPHDKPPSPGTGIPFLPNVHLAESFFWVQALLFVAGLLSLSEARYRLFGIGALVFAVIPWGMLVERDAAPARAYNQCLANLMTISQAVDSWREEHGDRPPASLAQLAPRYMKEVPSCSTHGKDTYSTSYAVDAAGHFTVGCSLGHATPAGSPPGYPRYQEGNDRFLRSP